MKKIIALLTLVVTTTLAANPPMNILMIAIDDLNDWVGFLDGHPQTQTPNLDRLAAQGMVFENASCSGVACNPSRSALMSGIPPYASKLFSNQMEMRKNPILKDSIMLPRYFSNQGYTSLVRGKLFHHADMEEQSWDIMSNQRKDKLDVPKGRLTDMSPYKDMKIDNGLSFVQKPAIAWKGTMQPKELTQDYQNALWTAQWLLDEAEQETPKPFFLACGIFRPHLPWTVPNEFYARFDKDSIQLPPINENDFDDIAGGPSKEYLEAKEKGLLKEAVWAYLANIAYADDCVGVILDALEKSPYKDNTLVVLWSDHGWHVGEKMRYKKSTLWERTARMPLLIKVPGSTPGRTVRPVNLIDLYPTLIDLAKLPKKDDLYGRSFAPLFQNPDMEWNYPAITASKSGFSLRTERWRYISKKNGEELYDHSKDPNEWTNLAKNPEYAHIIKEMKQHLPTVRN